MSHRQKAYQQASNLSVEDELRSRISLYVEHVDMEKLKSIIDEHLGFIDENFEDYRKWKISDNSISGRGVIATEDIEPGETILVDHPLIYGPRSGFYAPKGCTVCCRLDETISFLCPHCSLKLCSVDCQLSDIHEADCFAITKFKLKVPIEEVSAELMSKALAPIRSLQLNAAGRSLLSELQVHKSPQHGQEIRNIDQYFDFSEEEKAVMLFACYVLDANAHQIATKYGGNEMSQRGLYPVASLMNHSCLPNTRHHFNKDNRMRVKAVKKIFAGDEIFGCYTDILRCTLARRHHLSMTKHFLCNCVRCSDPTEFGTWLAAMKCFSKSCHGSVIPVNPLSFTSEWKCSDCGILVPAKEVGALQSALGSLIATLDFDNIQQIEEFIQVRLVKYIPRTNHIFLDLRCRLIWLVGESKGSHWHEVLDSQLLLKEDLCRSVLQTLEALGVGEVHLRGLLLYHLHATLVERARREPRLYPDFKQDIQFTIEEAYKILEGDISAPHDLELRKKYLGADSSMEVTQYFDDCKTIQQTI